MRLVILDNDGNVHACVENIEDFDLSKPLARSDVVNKVIHIVEKIKRGIGKHG